MPASDVSNLPSGMGLTVTPHAPTWAELQANAIKFPPKAMHGDWAVFVNFQVPSAEAIGDNIPGALPDNTTASWGI